MTRSLYGNINHVLTLAHLISFNTFRLSNALRFYLPATWLSSLPSNLRPGHLRSCYCFAAMRQKGAWKYNRVYHIPRLCFHNQLGIIFGRVVKIGGYPNTWPFWREKLWYENHQASGVANFQTDSKRERCVLYQGRLVCIQLPYSILSWLKLPYVNGANSFPGYVWLCRKRLYIFYMPIKKITTHVMEKPLTHWCCMRKCISPAFTYPFHPSSTTMWSPQTIAKLANISLMSLWFMIAGFNSNNYGFRSQTSDNMDRWKSSGKSKKRGEEQ